ALVVQDPRLHARVAQPFQPPVVRPAEAHGPEPVAAGCGVQKAPELRRRLHSTPELERPGWGGRRLKLGRIGHLETPRRHVRAHRRSMPLSWLRMNPMRLYRDPDEPGRLGFDRDFYRRIAQAKDGRRLVHDHIVPIRSGYAWPVKAGSAVRIVAVEGPEGCGLHLLSLATSSAQIWGS